MTDYISREALFKEIEDYGIIHPVIRDNELFALFCSIPAADVRPVVRGEWVNDHNGKYSVSGDNFYCSICKDPSLRAFGKPAKTNYCPNCGADMRKER